MQLFVRSAGSATAGLVILAAAPAWAQENRPTTSEQPALAEQAEHGGEVIVVTGTRIRGRETASQVTAIAREAIVSLGQVDLGEALRALPQNFAGGQNPGVGLGAGLANSNVNSASSPNLRGLGADATLTLLNGHRMPSSAAFGGVDISAIPLAAIDRIEVVPDGASALYGSDAVAGVVNVRLRTDVEGVSTSGQLAGSTDGGYFRRQADIVGGEQWSTGGIMLAYDFMRNARIEARQRDYAAALAPATSLFPSQRRHAALLSAHQVLSAGIEAKLDATYSDRRSRTVSASDQAHQTFRPRVESFVFAPSLEIDVGAQWQVKLLGLLGRDRTHYNTTIRPAGGVNRLTSGCFCNRVTSLEWSAEGPVFDLGGGAARLAVGMGLRKNGMKYTRAIDGRLDDGFNVTRNSRYVYGEFNMPLVGERNARPGIARFNLSAAMRYEDYPGLDRLATPRLGVLYAPLAGLTVRGTWGRSFKAPTLYQQYTAYQVILLPAAAFGAGAGSQSVFYTSGGNPDLKPERARSWTAGIEWQPGSAPGLTLSATWFDIHYYDRVVQPIPGSIAAAFRDPGYASLIDFSPSAEALDSLIAGAQLGLQNFTGAPYDPANVVAFIDNRNINVAAQDIHGLDARISWSGQAGAGRIAVDISGTWLSSRQQLTGDLPEVDLAGTIFNPPDVRSRASASYGHGRFAVSASVNYTGELVDRRFEVIDRLAPSATLDLSASYTVLGRPGRDPGLIVSLGIQNLLDDEPAVIRTTGPTDTPYDSTNYSPIGRLVSIGIRRKW